MRKIVVVMVIMLTACGARGQSQASSAPVNDPMAAIAWLAGDWSAEVRVNGTGKPASKVASYFHPGLGGRVLTFSMRSDGVEQMTGLFAFDGSKKSVAFWYVMADEANSSGADRALATGTVQQQDGYVLLDFVVTRVTGESAGHFQTRIVRLDANHYRWEVYADLIGEGIQKLNEIIFTRTG